jgi:hypothetical protein
VRDTYAGGQCDDLVCAHPVPGDFIRVEVKAHGAEVITPLIRPFFGCTNGNIPDCHVTLSSAAITRFEGQDF